VSDAFSSISKIRVEVWRDVAATYQLFDGSGQVFPRNVELGYNPDQQLIIGPSGIPLVDVSKLSEVINRFFAARFIPAIRSASANAQGTAFEIPLGAALAGQWHSLKTGDDKKGNLRVSRTEKTLKTLFGFDELQINV
jgi:hypothetical protein